MKSTYCPYEFRIHNGTANRAELIVRVHAPSRDEAWRRVMQMHPRASEVKTRNGPEREQSHNPSNMIANFTN